MNKITKKAKEMKKKKKVLMVRLDPDLWAEINKKRKKEHIGWEALISALFRFWK